MAWPSIAYVQAAYDRFNKLYKIGHGQSAAAANNLAYPGTTNYQAVTLFSNLQSGIKSLAYTIPAGPKWVKKSFDYSGSSTIAQLTWADFATLAPLPLGDWTRKAYREVVDNTSTTDVFVGQAIANGQRAYRRSDKQIVDRVAGAWVVNTTAVEPDIITTTGFFQAGDLIGDWLFTEMYAVMAVMGALLVDTTWTNPSPDHIGAYNPSGSSSTAAAERSAVEAAWGTTSPADTFAGSPLARSQMSTNSGGSYIGTLERYIAYSAVTAVDVAPATVDFYVYADSINPGTAGDYLSEGDPVLYLQWNRWDAAVVPDGTTHVAQSANLGSLSDLPNNPWCPDPAPVSDDKYAGWRTIVTPKAVVTYSV